MMDDIQHFLTGGDSQVPIGDFLLHMVLASVLAALLGYFYVRFGHSLSNRKALAATLTLVCITTMIIISIVKSSLALSLGLVGALSIVRFRTAIKDPEELAFFFIAIAIGLGMGAGQVIITISGVLFLLGVIFLRTFHSEKELIQNLIITIPEQGKDFSPEKLLSVLRKNCSQLELRRFEDIQNNMEMSLFVRFNSFDKLLESKKELQKIDSKIQFSYLEII